MAQPEQPQTEQPQTEQPQTEQPKTDARPPLTRERVLRAAVALADEAGIEAVSMRRLGQELGVEAMSLYNHVTNKEDLLTGMSDLVVEEIGDPRDGPEWKTAMRETALAAREVLKRHPWAPRVIESRPVPTPTMLRYFDGILGILFRGGFSVEMAHHALHALGSRVLGFTQEMFNDSEAIAEDPEMAALMLQQMVGQFPHIAAMMEQVVHDQEEVLGTGCDDQFEFEFTLDLLLDGLERMLARR